MKTYYLAIAFTAKQNANNAEFATFYKYPSTLAVFV